jgi:hypothetical protein
MNTSRAALAAIIALGALLGTTACAGASPSPAATAESGVADPAMTPAAEPTAGAPQPIIDLACDELLATATVAATMPASVVPAVMARAELGGSRGNGIPTSSYVRSLGGLACEWNNGQAYNSSAGSNPDYLGIRVLVLPDAVSQWERFETYYSSTDALGLYCAGMIEPLYCTHEELVGTNWVSAEIIGAGNAPAAEAIANEVLTAVSTAGPGGASWMPPADTIALSPDCEATLPVTPVGLLLGVGVPLVAQGPAGGWSLGAGARENASAAGCIYTFEGSMAGVGSIDTLPAGAWAWREVRPLISTPAAPERVEIALLGDGDEAWVRCTADGHSCFLDLVVGGNWVQLQAWDTEGESDAARVTVEPRAGILRLGEAVLGELRG